MQAPAPVLNADGAVDGRVGWLDGVRGIAILAVIVFHFEFLARQDHRVGADAVLDKVTGLGWAGVGLFFVLSGYLITGILIDTKSAAHRLRNFYARRILRIFPLYYGFLVALFIVLPLLDLVHSREYDAVRASQGWFWLYLSNIWILVRHGQSASLFGTGHLWSLAVEEQFYLFWPAVVFACSRRQALAACAGVILLAPVLRVVMYLEGATPYVLYTFTPTTLDALAFGAALAIIVRSPSGCVLAARVAVPAAVVSGAWIVALIAVLQDASNLTPGMELAGLTPISLFFTATIAHALAWPGRLRGWLGAAPLRAAGHYSYAMYVFHWPIAIFLARTYGVRTALPSFPASAVASEALFFVVAGGTTLAISWLSWNLCEKHVLKLKSRFRDARAEPLALSSAGPARVADAA